MMRWRKSPHRGTKHKAFTANSMSDSGRRISRRTSAAYQYLYRNETLQMYLRISVYQRAMKTAVREGRSERKAPSLHMYKNETLHASKDFSLPANYKNADSIEKVGFITKGAVQRGEERVFGAECELEIKIESV